MSQYKNPVCRGSYELGTACRTCEKCVDERLQRVRDHEFDHTKYVVSKVKKGCPNCAELKAENERLRGDLVLSSTISATADVFCILVGFAAFVGAGYLILNVIF